MRKLLKNLLGLHRNSIKDKSSYNSQLHLCPRINLGCGDIVIPGWINVDIKPLPHVHIQTSSLRLDSFSDSTIGSVYICHALEHFTLDEVRELLSVYFAKLKNGGHLLISVPSFDAIIALYEAHGRSIENAIWPLVGGQRDKYDFHKCIFNRVFLSSLLLEAGFSDVREWETENEFGNTIGDWSNVIYKTPNGDIPISLNLKAVKLAER